MAYNKNNFTSYSFKGIPRDLWNRAKAAATESGLSLRVFLIFAIKEKLEGRGN